MDDESKNIDPLVLLVTANVGSLFEDMSRLLEIWINELVNKVCLVRPQFLALHLQEVGGKTYEKCVNYVDHFITTLQNHARFADYKIVSIYFDEDFKNKASFTALGNLYFAHKTFDMLKNWNFDTHNWEDCLSSEIFKGNIELIQTKDKSKFPPDFYPNSKWSRKGFMRTRWNISGTVLDLINIHLFHDASNLAACENHPSIYSKYRHKALLYTLAKFHVDSKNGFAPLFIFGDFNFRCNTNGVVKALTQNMYVQRIQSARSDDYQLHYKKSDGRTILVVGKKDFKHESHQLLFKQNWLKKYDHELEMISDFLTEFTIKFPPTYPFEEDPQRPEHYMPTRCPSWCDRILLSSEAMRLMSDKHKGDLSYNAIGEHVCMGDHKPVYLQFRLRANQGMVCDAHKFKRDADVLQNLLRSNPVCIYEEEEGSIAKYVEKNYISIHQKTQNDGEAYDDTDTAGWFSTIVKETKL